MKLQNELINRYVNLLKSRGINNTYKYLIESDMLFDFDSKYPLEMLEVSQGFFSLYRTSGNNDYFELGKVLRRAAHTLYRRNLIKNKIINNKFLNLVT